MTAERWLLARLATHGCIGLDTSPFIYHLQDHTRYAPITAPLFARIEAGKATAVSSTLTMLELLVQPFRDEASHIVDAIYALASRYPHLAWIAPTLEIVQDAARLRARYQLRTPDAVQLATAIGGGATALVTNHRALRRVAEIEVIVLEDAFTVS